MTSTQLYEHMQPLNPFNSNNFEVESTYIIRIKDNDISEKYAQRCAQSCTQINQKYNIWDAYDGVSMEGILIPEHLVTASYMRLVKITDHYLTRTEVACALSHISLWFHCMIIDRPIVILEHDAVMEKQFVYHKAFNSIIYLGCKEWKLDNKPINKIPPFSSEGNNYLFINRAHAYSIDPAVAKNMISHIIKYGINMPLDMLIRADLFNITHHGMYAYDHLLPELASTIKNRPELGRTTVRNDNLSY